MNPATIRHNIHYLRWDEHIKCNFLDCFAGSGVAGNGTCFLGGYPHDPDCPLFENGAVIEAIEEAITEREFFMGIRPFYWEHAFGGTWLW